MFNEKTREFQKGFDAEARRRDREDDRLKLRKEDRETKLQAKRRAFNDRTFGDSKQTIGNDQRTDPNIEMLAFLPQYVQGCFTEQVATQYECCQRIRRLLSIETNPPIRQVVESGVVPRLVQFLRNNKYEKLQFEAAWALTNIASSTAEHTAAIIRNGAIPVFISLLASSNTEVCDQAVWALGNIAGDSPQCRNLVLEHNVLQNLLPICVPCDPNDLAKLSLLRNAAWALSNLMRGKPSPSFEYIKQTIQTLATLLLNMSDLHILCDCCWGFSYISDSEIPVNDIYANEQMKQEAIKMKLMHESGALKKLIDLLGHPNLQVVHPALRAIGNIVTGADQQTELVINLGVLDKLKKLLGSNVPQIKKETCWTISNITAGPPSQIELVEHTKIIPILINMLSQEKSEIQQECVWALANITSSGNSKQIRYLVNQGIIKQFCALLHSNISPGCLMIVLEGIEHILIMGKRDMPDGNRYAQWVEECGGLDALEAIQANENTTDDIFEKAACIVKEFFDGQDDNNDSEQHGNVEGKESTHIDSHNQFEFGINNSTQGFSNFNEKQPFYF